MLHQKQTYLAVYFRSSNVHHVHMEKIGAEVGRRIAEIRTAQGMTQASLASRMSAGLGKEVRPLTVTRIEGGKRPLVVDEVVVIASVLGVHVVNLLPENDQPLPPLELQRAKIEYDNAVNALKAADDARYAASMRWRAAHDALVSAHDEAQTSDGARLFAGYYDDIAMYLDGGIDEPAT